ncbi:MAG: GNAT family N-acetyltransferase [Pseudomonadota bacterium]
MPENTSVSKSAEIRFKGLALEDIPIIVSAFADVGWHKPAKLFEHYLVEQNNGLRKVWLAFCGDEFAGYVTLKWISDYPAFKTEGIPEINDLNVLPKYRSRGIGAKLLELAETETQTKSKLIGIGVGLYADYGRAQIMYVKRGYVPDGRGITYYNQVVPPGKSVMLDDDLVLWFVKKV